MFELFLNAFNSGIVTILIIILFFLTLVKGIIQYNKFYYIYRDIKFYISIISLYLVYLSYSFVMYELYYLILNTFNLDYIDQNIFGLLLKISLFILLFFIYRIACKCVYVIIFKNMIFDSHEFICKLPIGFKSVVFGLIKIPRAILNVLILVFSLNTFNMFLTEDNSLSKAINSSEIYSELSDKIILPFKYDLNEIMLNILNPIFDTFKGLGVRNVTYLYNGVTIDEATKSRSDIREFAIESTSDLKSSYDKAKKLYDDIIDILEYDNEKSEDILENNFSNLSGAISAFENRKGICFDYASLYSVFAESIEIPTRIIVGKGFDGNEWINHAWNEVYISELNKWIEVDTTFGETSNYFDIDDFDKDHRKERIIWEFSV